MVFIIVAQCVKMVRFRNRFLPARINISGYGETALIMQKHVLVNAQIFHSYLVASMQSNEFSESP